METRGTYRDGATRSTEVGWDHVNGTCAHVSGLIQSTEPISLVTYVRKEVGDAQRTHHVGGGHGGDGVGMVPEHHRDRQANNKQKRHVTSAMKQPRRACNRGYVHFTLETVTTHDRTHVIH